MQQGPSDIGQGKCSWSSNRIDARHTGSNILTGNHVWQELRGWLSSPDPSTNHNTACNAHHEGMANWFFQGKNNYGKTALQVAAEEGHGEVVELLREHGAK